MKRYPKTSTTAHHHLLPRYRGQVVVLTWTTHTMRKQGNMLRRLPLVTLPWPRTKLFNPRVLDDTHSQGLQIMVILQTNAERRLSKRSPNQPSTYLVVSRSLSTILIVV